MRADFYDDFNPNADLNDLCFWLEGLNKFELRRIADALDCEVTGSAIHVVDYLSDRYSKKKICQAIDSAIFAHYRTSFKFKKPLLKREILTYLSFLTTPELALLVRDFKASGYLLVLGEERVHHLVELRSCKVNAKNFYQALKRNSLLPGHSNTKQKEKQKTASRKNKTSHSLSSNLLNTSIPLDLIERDVAEFYKYLGNQKKQNEPLLFKNYNLLFHGQPGTGKTMFASTLAQNLGRPLITVTASDLLSHYVGETEEFIAASFEEARKKKAILFLDEMDAILGERDNASASWERSQVNEFLVQMERFEGVFIASTNYPKILDKALERRFAHKIGFDYLKSEAKLQFFDFYFKQLLTESERDSLFELENLAPGDFKVALQRCFFREDQSAKLYLDELSKISSSKKRKPVGLMCA